MNNKGGMSERMMLVMLFPIFIGVLAVAWAIIQRPIGIFYHLLRSLESLGLWYLTPWGRSFHDLTLGRSDSVPFLDIYVSSIPFGLAIAALVIFIGHTLQKKAKREHLNAYIAHEKSSPPDWRAIMRRQSLLFPANGFFLDYSLNEFTDISKGVARFPHTAIDVIVEADAFRGTRLVDGLEGLICDKKSLGAFLETYIGPSNPFFTIGANYTISNDPLPSDEALDEIVNFKLHWHHCLILYPALFRLYGSLVDTGQEFKYFTEDSEEFLREVWRDLNELKRKKGDSLIIGFQDSNDEQFKRATFKEKHGDKETLFVLEDYLKSPSTSDPSRSVGDQLPTVQRARAGILEILKAHRHDSNRVPAGKDTKKGFIYKKRDLLSDSERIFAKVVQEQQLKFVQHIRPILLKHAYVSTMLATVLDEKSKGARSLGVLAPAQFRWMRFYDYKLWCFLRPIGGKTPVPEAAGVYQHYLDELTTEQAITTPQIDRAIEAIINEADNYITADKILELTEATRKRREGEVPADVKAANAVREISREAFELFPRSPGD